MASKANMGIKSSIDYQFLACCMRKVQLEKYLYAALSKMVDEKFDSLMKVVIEHLRELDNNFIVHLLDSHNQGGKELREIVNRVLGYIFNVYTQVFKIPYFNFIVQ